MIDKLNLSEYEMKKFEIGNMLAEEFLSTKTRSKAYKEEGYDTVNGPDEARKLKEEYEKRMEDYLRR